MQASDISLLANQVLWASFGLSLLFGAIAQKTHFCTMGAVSDIVNMGDWTRLRQWALAVGVGMMGFGLLVFIGQIDSSKTLYFSMRWLWLSAAVGGVLFGIGMVLASGCGSKTLVRIGSGSLKSMVVFLAMGVTGFATMKGVTAVLRGATVDLVAVDMPGGASVPQLFSASFDMTSTTASLVCGLFVGVILCAWALAGKSFFRAENLLAGLGLGLVLTCTWWVSGHMGHLAEHPETLEEAFLATNSGRMEALSFVAPISYTLDWLMFFSDKNKLMTVGIASVIGVIAGSSLSAIVSKTFRWEGFGGTEDVANHLVGGTLMGIGGVTAMGCTIGQGLSGLSTLSLTSFVAVAGIFAGAVIGLKYQTWRLEKSD
jgi:uncharacterized membrane protein YedE/YeeE